MENNNKKAYLRLKKKLKTQKGREDFYNELKEDMVRSDANKFKYESVADFKRVANKIIKRSEEIEKELNDRDTKFESDIDLKNDAINGNFETIKSFNKIKENSGIKVVNVNYDHLNNSIGKMVSRHNLFDLIFRAKTLNHFNDFRVLKPINKFKFKNAIKNIKLIYGYIKQYFEFLSTDSSFNESTALSNKPFRHYLSNNVFEDIEIYRMASKNKLYRYHMIIKTIFNRNISRPIANKFTWYFSLKNKFNKKIDKIKYEYRIHKLMMIVLTNGIPIKYTKVRKFSENIYEIKNKIKYQEEKEKQIYAKMD